MKIKKFCFILMATMLLFVLAGCSTEETKEADDTETTANINICETIEDFEEKSQQGIQCRLDIEKLKEKNENVYWDNDIIYDGNVYYSEGQERYTYKYLIDLTGRYKDSEYDSRHVVLTNEKYTWEDLLWYLWGNQQYDEDGNKIYDEGACEWPLMKDEGVVCEIMWVIVLR